MWQHSPPRGPVVFHILSPYIEFIIYAFIIQYACKAPICIRVFMIAATGKQVKMMAIADLLQDGMIREIGYVMNRAVKIYIIIKIALGIFREIVHAAHSNKSIDQVGPLEK